MAIDGTGQATIAPATTFGGTVATVLASHRIAPPPATLEEARNAPGRAEKIEALTRRIEAARASSTCSSSRSRSPAA